MEGRLTFGKKERLCSKRLIDLLFGGSAQGMKAWPVRIVYLLTERLTLDDAPVEVMMSVSKRCFKRAVKRNRVKRQLREAYRLHRQPLTELMADRPQQKLLLAFIWQDDKLHASSEVTDKVVALIKRLSKQLRTEKTDAAGHTAAGHIDASGQAEGPRPSEPSGPNAHRP